MVAHLTVIGTLADICAYLEIMRAHPFELREGIDRRPTDAPRVAILLCEVISAIPRGRDGQILAALPPDASGKASERKRVVKQSSPDRNVVGNGAGVIMSGSIRRRGLGVVEVQVYVSEALRRYMNGGGDPLAVGDDPVELGKGVHALLDLLIVRKRLFIDLRLAHGVLESFGEIEFAGNQWPFHVEPRGGIADA